jgi:hypothetical protein
MFTAMRDAGKPVITDGKCFPRAVTIILKQRIYVTERAVLGLHADWIANNTGKRSLARPGSF